MGVQTLTVAAAEKGRAMGGWRDWFKVQAALDDRQWDFRTVDGIAGETGLAPDAVARLLGEHRSELRPILLRGRTDRLHAEVPAEDFSSDLRRDADVCETVMAGLVLCGIVA